MKKLLLMTLALIVAALVGFWVGDGARYSVVEGQGLAKVFPKVEVRVRIDGIDGDFLAGLKGLGAECDVEETLDPETQLVRKIPGRLKWGDITLKRAFVHNKVDTTNNDLYEWRKAVTQGELERKNGSIILLAADGTEVASYEIFDAWPCKWKGFQAPNADSVFPTEEVDLVVQKVLKVRER